MLVGLALQWLLALVVLKTEPGRMFFDGVGRLVTVILHGADEGARFVFGPLAGGQPDVPWQAIAGIKIMTTIIIVATLSTMGYHYGILQRVVAAMAWVMRRAMGVSGAESLSCAANVFIGQTEAPLHRAPVPLENDPLGADDAHDRRLRDHRGRSHGGLRRHAGRRRLGAAS